MRKHALSGIAILLVFDIGFSFAYAQPQSDRPKAHSPGEPGVIAPKLTWSAAVSYPVKEPPTGETGCTLVAVINADGTPSNIHVAFSAGVVQDQAAVQAVRESAFVPGSYRGERAPIWVDIWVPFHANRTAGPVELLPLVHVDQPATVLTSPGQNEPTKGHRARFEGTVLISVLVSADGLPAQPHVLRPLGLGLDEKALALVEEYRFKPAMRNAIPVPERLVIEQRMYLY